MNQGSSGGTERPDSYPAANLQKSVTVARPRSEVVRAANGRSGSGFHMFDDFAAMLPAARVQMPIPSGWLGSGGRLRQAGRGRRREGTRNHIYTVACTRFMQGGHDQVVEEFKRTLELGAAPKEFVSNLMGRTAALCKREAGGSHQGWLKRCPSSDRVDGGGKKKMGQEAMRQLHRALSGIE